MLLPGAAGISEEGFNLANDFAKKHDIPLIGLQFWQVEAGSLYTYTIETEKMSSQAAILASRILKGELAGKIPIVTPNGSLWINYKTAQELNLNLNQSLLSQASKIIY